MLADDIEAFMIDRDAPVSEGDIIMEFADYPQNQIMHAIHELIHEGRIHYNNENKLEVACE